MFVVCAHCSVLHSVCFQYDVSCYKNLLRIRVAHVVRSVLQCMSMWSGVPTYCNMLPFFRNDDMILIKQAPDIRISLVERCPWREFEDPFYLFGLTTFTSWYLQLIFLEGGGGIRPSSTSDLGSQLKLVWWSLEGEVYKGASAGWILMTLEVLVLVIGSGVTVKAFFHGDICLVCLFALFVPTNVRLSIHCIL